jgi:5-methylcytosine-specific restriction protein A
MPTYLLTWNPNRWQWDNLADEIGTLRETGELRARWSCGTSKRIQPGDRVFLLRQGVEPRGIVGAGEARSSAYEHQHWDPKTKGRVANYIDVSFTELFDPDIEPILPRSMLEEGALGRVNWNTQMSGITIPEDAAAELEVLWARFLETAGHRQRAVGQPHTPEEVDPADTFDEGAVARILVNKYERDPEARRRCIEHYGTDCQICGFDFAESYGEAGAGIIHVHHLIPISKLGPSYKVDPIKDLLPVCPNCHAFIHSRKEQWKPEEVDRLMEEAINATIAKHPELFE